MELRLPLVYHISEPDSLLSCELQDLEVGGPPAPNQHGQRHNGRGGGEKHVDDCDTVIRIIISVLNHAGNNTNDDVGPGLGVSCVTFC